MKKQHTVLIGCLMSLATPTTAQFQVPMFSMPMHFEDSLGNKDTLVVGYDVNASDDHQINWEFGEVLLNGPFDSIFEVRAVHSYDGWESPDSVITKTLVANYELYLGEDSCGSSEGFYIIVRAKYPPIRITFDHTRMTEVSCRQNTFLSSRDGILGLPFWWAAPGYRCLTESNGLIVDDFSERNNPLGQFVTILYEVEGYGELPLPGYQFFFRPDGICQPLAADEEFLVSSLPAYPNPVTGELFLPHTIQSRNAQISILDHFGRIVYAHQVSLNSDEPLRLSVGHLPEGLYLAKIMVTSGKTMVYRFVKQ